VGPLPGAPKGGGWFIPPPGGGPAPRPCARDVTAQKHSTATRARTKSARLGRSRMRLGRISLRFPSLLES